MVQSLLNMDFIRKAEKVTSFNIVTKDFETLKYKKEIQHLFNKHFFPKFDLGRAINSVDKNRLNSLIKDLKNESNENFKKLHGYNLKGVGPGEATMFFLINNAHLGGGSSAGVDLVVGPKKYEIKAVKVSNDRLASDFKLGGTVPLSDIIVMLNKIRKDIGAGGTQTEMSGSIMKRMQLEAPAAFQAAQKQFADIAYNLYFKRDEIIFINNSATAGRIGMIEAIKNVKLDEIFIERVTSGTIKPKVKI